MNNTNSNSVTNGCALPAPKDIKVYIRTFLPILEQMMDNNMVLAGTLALRLHGLNISRDSGDLDVVLYQPTKKQLDILTTLSPLQVKNPFHDGDCYDNDLRGKLLKNGRQKTIKFQKDGLFIDFILEHDKHLPDFDLLVLKYESDSCNDVTGILNKYEFKIQNIFLNILAKNSYILDARDGLNIYRREKDMKDLIMLKNENFNF